MSTRAGTLSEVLDLVKFSLPTLSPQCRKVAETLLADPMVLSWTKITDFARMCGVPPSSVVRFAQRMGFHGYRALQAPFRDALKLHVQCHRVIDD